MKLLSVFYQTRLADDKSELVRVYGFYAVRHAVTTASVDPDLCLLTASLGHKELTFSSCLRS